VGQWRHFDGLPMTSGFPPEADIVTAGRHVSKVPRTEVAVSFDHCVGAQQERFRNRKAYSFRGLEIDG
jgi:hypothetical protein